MMPLVPAPLAFRNTVVPLTGWQPCIKAFATFVNETAGMPVNGLGICKPSSSRPVTRVAETAGPAV